MAIPEIIAQARQIDVADLVSRYVALEKVTAHEWQGPCPKCGGNDRLHAKKDGWFCRQCKPIDAKHGWHDAVDFMRFVSGCTFQEATERLTNQPWPERKKPSPHQQRGHKMDERTADWFDNAAKLMAQHQLALPDSEGAEYLQKRGLTPATWEVFGLGYAPTIKNPETNTLMPAIAMPWYRGGKLTAIRYRFLKPAGKRKITSLPDSRFGGVLFGGQGLPEWIHPQLEPDTKGLEQFCTLVLCEGEINAMSIWQVAFETRVHVMSVGSETGQLSAGAVAFAARYGRVIIWMDKEELAKKLVAQLPNSFGFSSPNGKDANDLLQAGTLGGQLVALRWQAAKTDEQRQQLIYDLWDGANEGEGLETGTAMAYQRICEHTGRSSDLIESETGKWITSQRVLVAA